MSENVEDVNCLFGSLGYIQNLGRGGGGWGLHDGDI